MGSWIPPAPTRLLLTSRLMSMRAWTASFRVELQSSVIQTLRPLYADRARTLWSPRASSRPSDDYILPSSGTRPSTSYYSFSRIMTSASTGAIIIDVKTRSPGRRIAVFTDATAPMEDQIPGGLLLLGASRSFFSENDGKPALRCYHLSAGRRRRSPGNRLRVLADR